MDIVNKEEAQEDMMTEHLGGGVMELDIDINIVMEQEECKEDTLTLMEVHLPGEESVVGVESYVRYPHHCGGEHTPLLRTGTITEKGVDLDCVIGLLTTGDQGEVGMGVEPELMGIKYCLGLEIELPTFIFRGYNAHCSKICPDRIRYA